MRNVCDLIHQIRRDSLQTFVGKLARWENVNDVGCILTAGIGDVDDAGRLLLLEIFDEADFKVLGLSENVAVVEAAGKRQKDAVFVSDLQIEIKL